MLFLLVVGQPLRVVEWVALGLLPLFVNDLQVLAPLEARLFLLGQGQLVLQVLSVEVLHASFRVSVFQRDTAHGLVESLLLLVQLHHLLVLGLVLLLLLQHLLYVDLDHLLHVLLAVVAHCLRLESSDQRLLLGLFVEFCLGQLGSLGLLHRRCLLVFFLGQPSILLSPANLFQSFGLCLLGPVLSFEHLLVCLHPLPSLFSFLLLCFLLVLLLDFLVLFGGRLGVGAELLGHVRQMIIDYWGVEEGGVVIIIRLLRMVSLMLGSEMSFSEEGPQKGGKGSVVNSFELGKLSSQKENRALVEHNARVRSQQNAQYQYAKQLEAEQQSQVHVEKEDILLWIKALSGPERFNLFIVHDQLAVMNIVRMSWADYYEDQSIFSKLQPSSSTTLRQQRFDKIENHFFKRKRTKPVLSNNDASNKMMAEKTLLCQLRVTDTNDAMDSLCVDYDFLQHDKISQLLDIMDLISNKAFLWRQCQPERAGEGVAGETLLGMPFWFQDGGFQTIGNYIVAYLERNIWKHYSAFKAVKTKKAKGLLLHCHPVLSKKTQLVELWDSLGQDVKLQMMNDLYAAYESYMDTHHENTDTMKQLYVNFRNKYIIEVNKNDLMQHYMKFLDNAKIVDKLLFTDFQNMKNIKCFINRLFVLALEDKLKEQYEISCKLKHDKKKHKQKANMQKKKQKKKEDQLQQLQKIKETSNENLCKIISSEVEQTNFGENKYNYTLLPQEENDPKCAGFIMSDQQQINMIFSDDFKPSKKTRKKNKKLLTNDTHLPQDTPDKDIESFNDQELHDLLELQKLQELKQQKNNNKPKGKKNKKYKVKNKDQKALVISDKEEKDEKDEKEEKEQKEEKEEKEQKEEEAPIQKQNQEQQVQEEQLISVQKQQEPNLNDFIEVTAKVKKPFCNPTPQITRKPAKVPEQNNNHSLGDKNKKNAKKSAPPKEKPVEKKENKNKVLVINTVTNNESDSFVTQDTESKKVKNKQNQWDFDCEQEINIQDIEFNKEKVLDQVQEDLVNQQIEQEIKSLYDQNQEIYPLRMVVFRRLQVVIQTLFNGPVKNKKQKQKVDIRLFGSCATGIQLPDSDMDISVFGFLGEVDYSQTQEVLQRLSDALQAHPWVVNHLCILTASVPVIKLEIDPRVSWDRAEKELNLSRKEGLQEHYLVKVDITVENGKQHLGALSSNLMSQWLNLYPALFKIAMLLKAFLHSRGLNDGFKGGLTSYQLLILIVSALKDLDGGMCSNYAKVLAHFFELYSRRFEPLKQGINIYNHPSSFYPLPSEPTAQLTVMDPIRFNKNLTANVTLVEAIVDSFRLALEALLEHKASLRQQMELLISSHSHLTQDALCSLLSKQSPRHASIIQTIINAKQ